MEWINTSGRNIFLALVVALLVGCWSKTHQALAKEPVASQEAAGPVVVLANLTDPEKLATLKPEARSINGRFDKVLYWLFVAEQQSLAPATALDRAFDQNHTVEPRRSAAKKQILFSYLNAKLWGMFTQENCDRLRRGKAGLISKGTYIGQIAEVDHIVPVSRYPQFTNEFANLQLMPAMQNRAKGNRMGALESEKLRELHSITSQPVTRN